MLKEFKEFAMKGNVVDLAIGVIIGAAFGAIVTSLVGDVIMPIIGAITGGLDFSNHFIPLSKAVTSPVLAEAKKQGAVIGWGSFLAAVNFLIIAFVLFLAVRAINSLKRSDAAPPPAPSKSETPCWRKSATRWPSKAARPPKPLRSKPRRSASNSFLNKFATRSLKRDLRSSERRRLKRGGTRTTCAR